MNHTAPTPKTAFRRKFEMAFAVTVAVISLTGCTTEQLENSVLGGAKNWCRHQTTGCHVNS